MPQAAKESLSWALPEFLNQRSTSLIKWVLFYNTKFEVVFTTVLTGTVPHIKWSVMKLETYWAHLNLSEAIANFVLSLKIFFPGPSKPFLAGKGQPSQVSTWYSDTERLEFEYLLCPILTGVAWGNLLNFSEPQSPKWGQHLILPRVGARIQ